MKEEKDNGKILKNIFKIFLKYINPLKKYIHLRRTTYVQLPDSRAVISHV